MVRSYVRLDLPSVCRQGRPKKIVPPRPRTPCWKGLCADSEEKREPVSDIDGVMVDSLKALDPNGRLEKRTFHVLMGAALLARFGKAAYTFVRAGVISPPCHFRGKD